MRPRTGFTRMAFFVGAAMLAAPSSGQESAPVGLVQADEDFPVSPPASVRSRRFYLAVSENRSAPDTNTIELPVVVLKSDAQDNRAPIVMLTGGPGTAGLSAAQYPGAYPWVGKRDFVIFGQRGTHYARPALMCPAYGDAAAGETLAALRICAARAASEGIDLSAYNTAESARDIEDLRRALGVEKIALYGLSYGTRLALSYARQFPDRVEALVLDSPLPFAADYDSELPANIRAVLQAIAQRCAGEATCKARHPDLWGRFSAAIAARTGMDIPAGEPSAAQIALYIAPGSDEDISNAPALMDAAANGILEPFPGGEGGGPSGGFAWGMRLSVWCSERTSPSGTPEPFAGINAPTFAPESCNAWPAAPRPADELQDPEGDFPTLILAGEYDVLTPPAWGERIGARLARARLVTIPAGLHSVTTNWGGTGCAMSIAGRFLENPTAVLNENEPPCLAKEPYPAFADAQLNGGAP